jgi:DNA-directed RNA polymerase specialized sigma24 family protein
MMERSSEEVIDVLLSRECERITTYMARLHIERSGRLLGSVMTWEDLKAEMQIHILKYLKTWTEEERDLQKRLFTICRSAAIQLYRKYSRRSDVTFGDVPDTSRHHRRVCNEEIDIGDEFIHHIDLIASERSRDIVRSSVIDGEPMAFIAKRHGITTQRVEQIVQHELTKLASVPQIAQYHRRKAVRSLIEGMVQYTLFVPRWRPTLVNQFIGRHWAKVYKMKQTDIELVTAYARISGIPKAKTRRRVSLEVNLTGRQKPFDEDAPWKFLLDGLVLAGLLVDDSPEWAEMGTVRCIRNERQEAGTCIILTDLGSTEC